MMVFPQIFTVLIKIMFLLIFFRIFSKFSLREKIAAREKQYLKMGPSTLCFNYGKCCVPGFVDERIDLGRKSKGVTRRLEEYLLLLESSSSLVTLGS